MKRLAPILLGLSLIANALCVAVWWRADHRAVPAPATPPPPVRAPARPALDARTWEQLRDADLREHAARLRQAGFPGDIMRAIIVAQLNETNEARRRALLGTPDAVNYWKQSRCSPAEEKALRELRREESKLLREALGADAEPPEGSYNRDAAGLAILSGEKAEMVRQLGREREEKQDELYATNGYNFEDSMALDREWRNAVRRALTPKEFLEFELRTSSRARSLREQLGGGDVTEDEFRSIYGMKTAFDEQFEATAASRDPSQIAVREKVEAALREQIRSQLGAERAAEFERMGNYDYRRTTEVIARLDLPRETSAQISTVQKEITQRRADLVRAHNAGTLNREAMMTQLRGLQQEATTRLTPLLRDTRGFEAYRQYAGTWIGESRARPLTTKPRSNETRTSECSEPSSSESCSCSSGGPAGRGQVLSLSVTRQAAVEAKPVRPELGGRSAGATTEARHLLSAWRANCDSNSPGPSPPEPKRAIDGRTSNCAWAVSRLSRTISATLSLPNAAV